MTLALQSCCFVKWFIDHLSITGRAGVIVPNGVLFGGTKAAIKVRELLVNEYGLQAVINLASGVFKPYSGVGTAILIIDRSKAKRKKDDFIWFYDLTADGFSLDDKRAEVPENDIPDIVSKWQNREEGKNSFRVPVIKILENEDRSLALSRFKSIIPQVIEHEDPKSILSDVNKIEQEILILTNKLLGELEK
ncbi:MAG: N-6 DNA methylase [Chloroflexi bacterium OLB14]|nr:MAG: N-6 DNA methylase [Chloroflexi bacterium OLB14]